MPAVEKALACPACGGIEQTPLENVAVAEQHRRLAPGNVELQNALTGAAAATALRYSMRRCGGCSLEFCEPLAAPNSDWYALAYQALDLYPARRWEFDHVLGRINSNEPVYELGCGGGAFLKLCREHGIAALGSDFSDEAVAECQRQGLHAELLELGRGINSAQVEAGQIVAFHVLEHLDHPAALFAHAAAAASAQATLWIAVPSPRRATRLLGEEDFLDQPPHHMTRWTEAALRAIGERSEWVLRETIYEPIATRTAVWWIASRAQTARSFPGWTGRARLWSRYPLAWLLAKMRYASMTGFTMLARFERASGGTR